MLGEAVENSAVFGFRNLRLGFKIGSLGFQYLKFSFKYVVLCFIVEF